MIKSNTLEILPSNFRHEKSFLLKNNLNSWAKLKNLTDFEINKIIKKDSMCTESRLKKIRAISILIIDLGVTPNQGYLLLHCGISSIKSLSILNPHHLLNRIGKLERSLGVKSKNSVDIKAINKWIIKAKELH